MTDLKETISQLASEIGFQRTVVASLSPMPEAKARYESWLARDFAGDMQYLKRDPNFRTSPALLFPQSLSALSVSVSYYTRPPAHPGPEYGQVAAYAVGLDYHVVLRAKLRQLKESIEKEIGRPLLGRTYTDDVALYEQALAARSGLGFAGKNTLIIGPKLSGSYNFVAELFTDLPLATDQPYQGTCGQCFRCASACPTGAIVEPRLLDARLCISYLTIESKKGIPPDLRTKLGGWVFGCDVCQMVCPYNQAPPVTPWPEFHPASGVGHFVNLLELLEIASQEEFHKRYLRSAIRRPKRSGLLRNALIVLGNQKPPGGDAAIAEFLHRESDPMLREHATWALSQYAQVSASLPQRWD
jgi:epoxyqueuosine reductase